MPLIPHALTTWIGKIGAVDILPLAERGFEDKPLGWIRVRPNGDAGIAVTSLRGAGARVTPARIGGRSFFLARTPEGDRIELDHDSDLAADHTDAFVEAVDRATQARRAGSSIGCWQASTDAITALLGSVLIREGSTPTPSALPAARERLPKPLREELKKLRAGLNLRDTLGDLRTTLAFADALAGHLDPSTGARLHDEVAALDTSLSADRFWNLRDVERWWAPHVRPGVLLRGRAPTSYSDEGFWDLPPDLRPVRFVDLRDPGERAEEPYPSEPFAVDSCPFGLDSRGANGLDEMYEGMPARSGPALAAVLRAVAAGDGPVLIHCRAGVDRTGVVVAMLGTWLGVPRERIVADYLASGQLVEERRLLRALEAAEALGIDRLISEAGASADISERARRRLLA